MSPDLLRPLLWGACLWPCVGLVAAALVRLRARRSVGPALQTEAGSRSRRIGLALGHLAVLAGSMFVVDPALRGPLILLLGLSLAHVTLTPSSGTRVLGRTGVRSGWTAGPFAKLDEWRLTGEHLRFRLGEEWSAVPCPPGLHGEVRARLEREAPGRESRFRS